MADEPGVGQPEVGERGGEPRPPRFDPLGRYRRLRLIRSLDPEQDHGVIYRLSTRLEFPWDYTRALELALFRTFCVPSISGLLARTGEFAKRPQKRYDDTSVLMTEIARHGYDSPRGKDSLRMVNRMHAQYDISNDDMLYVLSTFVYEPIRWIDSYGWRRLSEHEKVAAYHHYREVGRRMGIRSIPPDTEFERFNRAYEAEHFRYADSNHRVGKDSIGMMCRWYPRPLRGLVDRALVAVLDERMRQAFGFPEPASSTVSLVHAALRLHGAAERCLPARHRLREPKNRTYPGYPVGYELASLGALGSHGRTEGDDDRGGEQTG